LPSRFLGKNKTGEWRRSLQIENQSLTIRILPLGTGSDFFNHRLGKVRHLIEMGQVTAIILHFLAGLVAGSLFRVRTLLVLAFAVLAETGAVAVLLGISAALIWLLVSEIGLQFGYLGGIYFRGVLERAGIVFFAPQDRQPGNKMRAPF
jgi:hypothetical protein